MVAHTCIQDLTTSYHFTMKRDMNNHLGHKTLTCLLKRFKSNEYFETGKLETLY